jgi:hypothetical protein
MVLLERHCKKNCQGLKVLLVDERSLIGCTNLGWMEFMCKSGTGVESKSCGGLPVVVFLGDDVQLPPVVTPDIWFALLPVGHRT